MNLSTNYKYASASQRVDYNNVLLHLVNDFHVYYIDSVILIYLLNRKRR